MLSSRFVTATVFAFVMQAQGASAQMATPAEFPPASFTANQYIDSRGCAFVRANIGGIGNWVPRLTRDRRPLCGFQPSAVAGATATPPPVPLPANVPIITIPGGTSPAPAATTAGIVPAAAPPVQAPRTTRAPIATVASTTTPPRIRATEAQLPSPAAAAAPPVVTIAAPMPSPRIEVAPERQTLTRAQACAGRSGIQQNMISSRTGQPIDCGIAAVAVATAIPAQIRSPTPAVSIGQTVSLPQLCAEMDATGRRYISARTGLAVRCGPQDQVTGRTLIIAAAPQAMAAPAAPAGIAPRGPSGPSAPAAIYAPVATPIAVTMPRVVQVAPPVTIAAARPANTCAGFDPIAARYMASDRFDVRCGPQGSTTNARGTGNGNKSRNPFATEIPASNPPAGTPAPVRPPQGYKQVWEDGRINPNRGLPRVQVVRQP